MSTNPTAILNAFRAAVARLQGYASSSSVELQRFLTRPPVLQTRTEITTSAGDDVISGLALMWPDGAVVLLDDGRWFTIPFSETSTVLWTPS